MTDLFIARQQPYPYQYIDALKEIACSFDERVTIGMLVGFSYGVMIGKRYERQRNKNKKLVSV